MRDTRFVATRRKEDIRYSFIDRINVTQISVFDQLQRNLHILIKMMN